MRVTESPGSMHCSFHCSILTSRTQPIKSSYACGNTYAKVLTHVLMSDVVELDSFEAQVHEMYQA
jgi:hypothetical protein